MAKLNWTKARSKKPADYTSRIERVAAYHDSIPKHPQHRPSSASPDSRSRDIYIVTHATGERVVHYFKSLDEAHKGGFPWAL